MAGTLVVVCLVITVLLFAGFVVTLYVPSYSYSGISSLSSLSALTSDSKGCFGMDNVAVPSDTTSYLCRGFKFPNNPAQMAYHFEPQLDNAALTHHMILYRTASYLGDSVFECSSMSAGSSPFWAWAVGGGALTTPSNTGFSPSENFALQVHYDNPSRLVGQTDSSGVKVSFTPTLRQFQTVFLQLAVNSGSINLPPQQTVHISYTCNAGSQIPQNGQAKIWTVGLHAHTRSRKIWIEQIRGGSTIGFPGCDPFYDFNRQRFVSKNTTVLPGDILKLHCQYDTTADSRPVVGGDATTEEMCIAYLALYAEGFPLSSDVGCSGAQTIETPIATDANPCT
jgi:hypothetical protein